MMALSARQRAQLDHVVAATCDVHTSLDDLRGRRRSLDLALARARVCTALRDEGWSWPTIGVALRRHRGVMHAVHARYACVPLWATAIVRARMRSLRPIDAVRAASASGVHAEWIAIASGWPARYVHALLEERHDACARGGKWGDR
jgi:hypothetical protein